MRGRRAAIGLVGLIALGGCGDDGDASPGAVPPTTRPGSSPSTELHCDPGELIGTRVGDVPGDYASPDQSADAAFASSPAGASTARSSGSGDNSVTRQQLSESRVRYAVRTDGTVRLRLTVEPAPRGGWYVSTVEQCERPGSAG
jgi:hypothetical protein